MDILTCIRTYHMIVQSGSLTAAAEQLGLSKALTSKYLGELERHLGIRLLNRTTRRLHITEAGQLYYQKTLRLVSELDELEADIQQHEQIPQGTLKLSAPVNFGELCLAPVLAMFLKAYPQIKVDLTLSDQFVNLLEEGFDLALRIGTLADSSLIARRIASTRMICCASPGYFKDRPLPQAPQDLVEHHCIIDSNRQQPDLWQFQSQQQNYPIRVNGRLRVNSPMAIRSVMLADAGIGISPAFLIHKELEKGELLHILPDYKMDEIGIYVIYPPHRFIPAKVRVFIDFMSLHLTSF